MISFHGRIGGRWELVVASACVATCLALGASAEEPGELAANRAAEVGCCADSVTSCGGACCSEVCGTESTAQPVPQSGDYHELSRRLSVLEELVLNLAQGERHVAAVPAVVPLPRPPQIYPQPIYQPPHVLPTPHYVKADPVQDRSPHGPKQVLFQILVFQDTQGTLRETLLDGQANHAFVASPEFMEASLRLWEKLDLISVLSRPQLRTLEGQEASVVIGSQVAIQGHEAVGQAAAHAVSHVAEGIHISIRPLHCSGESITAVLAYEDGAGHRTERALDLPAGQSALFDATPHGSCQVSCSGTLVMITPSLVSSSVEQASAAVGGTHTEVCQEVREWIPARQVELRTVIFRGKDGGLESFRSLSGEGDPLVCGADCIQNAINTFSQCGKIDVVSTPAIITNAGEFARFEVGEGESNRGGLASGISLSVLPRITGTNHIELDVECGIADGHCQKETKSCVDLKEADAVVLTLPSLNPGEPDHYLAITPTIVGTQPSAVLPAPATLNLGGITPRVIVHQEPEEDLLDSLFPSTK